MCTSGSSSYLQFVPYGPFLIGFAQLLSQWIRIPLAILVIPALLVLRSKENALEISSAYVMTIFLILFSFLVHPDFRYYWIPVYALLLAASRNRGTLAIAVTAPVLSLLAPEILIQQVLPLSAILAMIVVEDVTNNRPPKSLID